MTSDGWHLNYPSPPKTLADARQSPKSAPWKLALAVWLKSRTQVRNRWLAEKLHLGVATAVSRNLGHFRRLHQARDQARRTLKSTSSDPLGPLPAAVPGLQPRQRLTRDLVFLRAAALRQELLEARRFAERIPDR